MHSKKYIAGLVAAALISSAAGYFAGTAVSRALESRSGFVYTLLSFFIGKTYEVPGTGLDGSFVLGDFESENDLAAWETQSASAEISGEHAASGLNSARVVFHPGKEANFQLEHYFTSRHAVFDWSPFRAVGFYIFNPAPDAARVLFQVGDRKGRFYKDQFFLNGHTGENFTVPVSKIAAAVNIKRIAYIRFFVWAPNRNYEFFFDDVRLEKA